MQGLVRPSFRCFVASTNPTKVEAMREALIDCFASGFSGQLQAISVPSGVAEQPVGEEQTLRGAVKRVAALRHRLVEEEGLPPDAPGGASVTLLAAIEGGLLAPS